MIIYKDVISNDEMFSDIYKIQERDIFYEVEGKRITRSEQLDDSLFGANPSADEVAESSDDAATESGIDIILNHKLQPTSFSKKAYMCYIKEYMKTLKANLKEPNPEKVQCFADRATCEVKCILKNFNDYEFYTGESMNPEGMVALLNYREDGITPYLLFFKDGLYTEKC
ncbi:translationally-controlled tumor protein homolog [Pholidichthys leucotaenia]